MFSLEWSLQTVIQSVTLIGIAWVGLRWVIRHYLADLLKGQQTTHEQTEHILNRLEKLDREVAVLRDRSDRGRSEFP